jgi:nucleotide-binding universal stress UspA family protein
MTGYKTILACLSDNETAAATLGLAFLVGKDHAAHIEALHVIPDLSSFMPLIGETVAEKEIEDMLTRAENSAKEKAGLIRRLFEEACANQGIAIVAKPSTANRPTAAWRQEVGREEDHVAKVGRLADLVVMARPRPDDGREITSVNVALMEGIRPLLLAPPVLPAHVGRTVAIFWNGSVEVAHAVAAAMPFLQQAAKVAILSVREETEADPDELVSYLDWHDIRTSVYSLPAGAGAALVSQALIDQANSVGADLIVMGAYTHSRLRQIILGGVTRNLLYSADLPLFLSH